MVVFKHGGEKQIPLGLSIRALGGVGCKESVGLVVW